MLVVLLLWLYIFTNSFIVGFGFSKVLKITSKSFILASVLGLFANCLLAFLVAIPFAVGFYFFAFQILLVASIGYFFWKEIQNKITMKIVELKSYTFKVLAFAFIFVVLIAIQSATIPTLPDNESYYIQTIKWISTYGFVPGLGNLHLFLAQTSGWHVVQSVYNFSFLGTTVNLLSGYISVLLILFSLKLFQKFHVSRNKIHLLFASIPIVFILIFPLLNVPSPDVATYSISLFLFYYFLKPAKFTNQNFSILLVLSLFLILIKITNLPLILVPILYWIFNREIIFFKNYLLVTLFSISFGLLFIKNALLTGYLFYPIHNFGVWNDSYKIPNTVLDYFFSKNMRYNFFTDAVSLQNLGFLELTKQWLLKSYTDLFFNASILICFIISPFLIQKSSNKKYFYSLYFILLLQFILLVFSSPQYRFFIGSILFFFGLFVSIFIQNRNRIYLGYGISVLFLSSYLFFPKLFTAISSNKIIASRKNLSLENTIFPAKISSLKTEYIKVQKDSLLYFSPTNLNLFWETGNGKLPCVSQKQFDYFEKYFQAIPQQRSQNLKDGFYIKSTNEK